MKYIFKCLIAILLVIAALPAVAAAQQSCPASKTTDAILDHMLNSSSFDQLPVFSNMETASWIYRAGYKEQAVKFLQARKTKEKNKFSHRPSDWSPAIKIIEAVHDGNLPDLRRISRAQIDTKSSDVVNSYMMPVALAVFGQYDALEAHYPLGDGIYIQNLKGWMAIRLLIKFRQYDKAVAVYRKHGFGYHSGNLFGELAGGLYRAGQLELLRTVLASEYKRAVEFRKNGEFLLCMAGGSGNSNAEEGKCKAEAQKKYNNRPLELFDQNAYTNCFFLSNQRGTQNCLAEIRQRYKASGQSYSDEELTESIYSYAVILEIVKYQAIIGAPDVKLLPVSIFRNMGRTDVTALSAVIAGTYWYEGESAPGTLHRRARLALSEGAKKRSTGAAAILDFNNTALVQNLEVSIVDYMGEIAELHSDIDSIERVFDNLHGSRNRAFERTLDEFRNIRFRILAKTGKHEELLEALTGSKQFTDRDMPDLLLRLSAIALKNGHRNLADNLSAHAFERYCSGALPPDSKANAAVARKKAFLLSNMFVSAAVNEGKLPEVALNFYK